jgi:hypothetical protein
MIPLLLGLPGKVKTLVERLTAVRAANLDNIDAATMANLDAAVSSAGKVRKTQVFTTSGTWTRPAGVDSVHVFLVGAGGGGGGVSTAETDRVGGGGGGGQVVERDLSVAGNLTVTIGAGGAGGATTDLYFPNRGSNGGDSTLTGGASLTAYGGSGGGGGGSSSYYRPGLPGNGNTGGAGNSISNCIGGSGGGAGGPALSPDIVPTAYGMPGVSNFGYRGSPSAIHSSRTVPNQPGPGVKGFGGGGVGGSEFAQDNPSYGYLIASPSDGGGAAGVSSAGGNAVANTGGGGGGAAGTGSTSYAGGDGADGICIITWFE